MTHTDLLDHIPTTVTEILGAIVFCIVIWMGRKVRGINDQVTNRHQTNLRDDLDDIHNSIRELRDLVTGNGRDITVARIDIVTNGSKLDAEIERSIAFDQRLLDELRDERERSIAKDAVLEQRLDNTPCANPPDPL